MAKLTRAFRVTPAYDGGVVVRLPASFLENQAAIALALDILRCAAASDLEAMEVLGEERCVFCGSVNEQDGDECRTCKDKRAAFGEGSS